MIDTVILDVDGTLVDSNYHHTLAWARAFAEKDLHPPLWRVHRAVGIGGDKLVGHVVGEQAEEESGDELRELRTKQFDRIIGEVTAFEGTRALLETVKERGHRLVLASSGQPKHIEAFLDLFDGTSLADAWTTSDDVEESKPAADLLEVALERVGGTRAVMVGDSVWDARAAKAADMLSIGLRTGGFSAAERQEAGAAAVFDGPADLEKAIAAGLLDRLAQ